MSTSLATSPPSSRFRCDGTFDLECASWDRFVVGCVYAKPENGGAFCSNDADNFVDELLTRRGHYYAHAGGIYDLLFVAERLRARGIRYHADLAQHRVTRLVVGGLTLRDSYSLVPFGLEEVAQISGNVAPTLPWPCTCRRSCGGYCRITERARQGAPELEAYCMEDCRVLYESLLALRQHAIDNGIDLRGTLGSTAWATAKAMLDLPDADLSWDVWRAIRAADKGGRLGIFKPREKGPGAHFDIVNAYPGALAHMTIPIGRHRRLGARHAQGALVRDQPGVYHCTVTIPDDRYVPPLPWRHGGAVRYPTGTVTGTWPLPELLAGIARGVTVDKVHSGVMWEGESNLFGELMADWYRVRKKVGKDTPLGAWQSRLAKALTGKFAEQPGRERIAVHPKSIRICQRKKGCRKGCNSRCGAHRQMDLWGHVWAAPYWKLSPSGHAHWSAYLRAATRVQWLEAAERYSPGQLCYGDTDSIWVANTRTTPVPVADLLGAWEMKHAWQKLEVRGPKVYRFVDGEGVKHFRGAPGMTEADWRRGRGIVDRGVLTFLQSVHTSSGDLFRRRVRSWSIPGRDHSPIWYGDRKLDAMTGITYPVDARELRAWVEAREARAAA